MITAGKTKQGRRSHCNWCGKRVTIILTHNKKYNRTLQVLSIENV